MNYVWEAKKLAQERHEGQMYGDKIYLFHLFEVQVMAYSMGLGEAGEVVALLHDILEDTDTTEEELYAIFPEYIVDAVVAMSKYKGVPYDNDPFNYNLYIERVKYNPLALKVKIADTLCNLTNSVKEGNQKRILKYSKQLALLAE